MSAADMFLKARLLYEKKEFSQALEFFRKSAAKGNTDAMFALGIMYLSGNGGNIDVESAKKYIAKAKQCDHPVAMFYWDLVKDVTQEDLEAAKAVHLEA